VGSIDYLRLKIEYCERPTGAHRASCRRPPQLDIKRHPEEIISYLIGHASHGAREIFCRGGHLPGVELKI
jgi:hypothetical protein